MEFLDPSPSPNKTFLPTNKTASDHVINKQGREVEIPVEFICPITLQLMDHPMVNKRGINFERDAILRWLAKGDGYCPMTRTPMSVSDLIRNRPLEAKIAFWRRDHGIPEPEKKDIDYSVTPLIGFMPINRDLMDQILVEHMNTSVIPTSHHTTAVSTVLPVPTMASGNRRRNFLTRVLNMASNEIDSMTTV